MSCMGVVISGREGGRTRFFAGLSRSTFDHASLSGRSAVPTPHRDASSILGAHYALSIHQVPHLFMYCPPFPLPVLPLVATILSPRITIVSSL